MSTFERAAAGGNCDLYGWWVRDPYRGLPRAWIACGCDVRDHPEGRCPKALAATEADRLRAQFERPLTVTSRGVHEFWEEYSDLDLIKDARSVVLPPRSNQPVSESLHEARAAAEDYRQQAASALEIIDGLHADVAALKAENMRLTDLLGQRAPAPGEAIAPEPFPSRALRGHAQQTGVRTP